MRAHFRVNFSRVFPLVGYDRGLLRSMTYRGILSCIIGFGFCGLADYRIPIIQPRSNGPTLYGLDVPDQVT